MGPSCRSIALSVGDEICLSPPGGGTQVSPTSASTTTPASTQTPAPVPTDIAQGTNTYCAEYHQVQPGEYCNFLVVRFSISLEDFLFLNQGVNEL